MNHFPAFGLTANRLRDLAIAGIALVVLLQNAAPRLRAFAQDGSTAAPGAAVALSSAFTYQGRITNDGLPQTGSVDLEVVLYDVADSGAPLATLPVLEDVAVTNGLFGVTLDFGSALFAGDSRWLEVRSRPFNSTGSFVSLGRQELTATPYALYARTATTAGSATTAITATSAGSATTAITATTAATADAAPWTGITGKPTGFADDADNELTLPFTASVADGGVDPVFTVSRIGVPLASSALLGGQFGGVVGTHSSAAGVKGISTTATSNGVEGLGFNGVRGDSADLSGSGVYGQNTAGGNGITGRSMSGVLSTGVFGEGGAFGVSGMTQLGTGVRGTVLSESPQAIGVHGIATHGFGVVGSANAGGPGASSVGVFGEGAKIGVQGIGVANGDGVVGQVFATDAYGVKGLHTASGVAVYGFSSGGNTGIGVYGAGQGDGVRGTTSSAGKAGISGIAAGGANNNWAGYFVGNVNVEGAITATGAITPSDARLKKDITTLTGALAKLMALRPVTFAWRDGHDADRAHPGFIAQEVREVLPEVVYEGSDEMRTLALSPSELVPVLVSAMQEQQARIEALEAKLASMVDGTAPNICLPRE